MKKKLLIILGAGSSGAVGLPSVRCLDQLCTEWGTEWATSCGITDHFRELWQSAETYYERGYSGLRPELNFETVLGDMIAMAHWMEPPPFGDTLRQAACCGTPPPHMKFRDHKELEDEVAEAALPSTGMICDEDGVACESSLEVGSLPEVEGTADHGEDDWRGRYGAQIELMAEYSFLLEKLAQHMRAESQRFNLANSPENEKYRRLLGGLRESFDIGVYNLNYDTAALDALPGAGHEAGICQDVAVLGAKERVSGKIVSFVRGPLAETERRIGLLEPSGVEQLPPTYPRGVG
jgi:hypothetical protein